jgi:hypothetical protein
VVATKWHLLARSAGLSDFRLDLYITKLTPEERTKAEKAADAWAIRNLGG